MVKATAQLPDDTTRIAVVADTHSAPHRETLAHVRAFAPTAILHSGDIGELAVLDELRAVAPVYAVRGNIDDHQLPDVLTLDLGSKLRILLTHIAVAGPRLRGEIARLARAEKAQLVVCGHSHVPFIGRDAGVTVFNPGSCGPRRFQLPIVFGTIDLAGGRVKLAHVSAETGERWLPPA